MLSQKKSKRRLPTMKDVAKLAGVSQTTVSFVVNDVPNAGIPEDTRQRILSAIEKLGYRPNVFAKNLRSSRSHIIGFVTDEIASSPYAGQIIQGAQEVAGAAGKILFLANTGGNLEIERKALEAMLAHQVEGIIYATMGHREITPPELLYDASAILLNCYDSLRRLPSVTPDEVNSTVVAIRSLLQKGHRRIAFINSVDTGPAVLGRMAGYQQALAEYHLPFTEDIVLYGKSRQDSGYENTLKLMHLPDPPTAIFCFNDQVAMGAYEALAEMKLSIPGDVAVIGFDNLEIIAAYLRPGLSTMELPHYEMGQWTVNFLLEQAAKQEKPQPVQHTIMCQYIARNSV